jgi:2-dehydro-3-deoxyphosphogluconate aldolase/(4S)-4-hydroxy-2-oxoglutarate aldolase
MDRIRVAMMMEEIGMIPLFFHTDFDIARNVVKACYDGGAKLLEFTNRGEFAHEVFSELSHYCKRDLPGMVLGVGSVTDAASASLYMMMGAKFVVTPVLREDIATVCNRRKVLWAPGCGSLGEIARAEELGCEIVKLFPGSTYGPGFVKAIRGPQPWTKIMPTGGVSPEESNLKSWFDAGVTCVGMGSKLISSTVIKNQDYEGLKKSVKETLNLIKNLRS